MPKPATTGLRRIIDALAFSIAGLRAAYTHEAAFRQELLCAVFMVPAGVYLGHTPAEQALLVAAVLLVLVVELLNSSVEAAVDRIGDEPHALSARAKDLGAAAVFMSIVLALCVWLLILLPRYL